MFDADVTTQHSRDFEKPHLLWALNLKIDHLKTAYFSEFVHVCEDGAEMAVLIKYITLSRRTIARWTEEVSSYLYLTLNNIIGDCEYYFLALDETNYKS